MLFLNKIKIPIPLPAESPPMVDASEIPPSKKTSTRKIEPAQFGIKPIIGVISVCKYGLILIMLKNLSMLTKYIIIPKIKLKSKINALIFNV